MVKHTQTIIGEQLTNCLNVFDHFLGLMLKGLDYYCFETQNSLVYIFWDVLLNSFRTMDNLQKLETFFVAPKFSWFEKVFLKRNNQN